MKVGNKRSVRLWKEEVCRRTYGRSMAGSPRRREKHTRRWVNRIVVRLWDVGTEIVSAANPAGEDAEQNATGCIRKFRCAAAQEQTDD